LTRVYLLGYMLDKFREDLPFLSPLPGKLPFLKAPFLVAGALAPRSVVWAEGGGGVFLGVGWGWGGVVGLFMILVNFREGSLRVSPPPPSPLCFTRVLS